MSFKRVIAVLLSLILFLSFVACNVEEKGGDDSTLPKNAMDLSTYMRYFVTHFYEPYQRDDSGGFDDNILCLIYAFCYDNVEKLDYVRWDTKESSLLIIEGEGLRNAGKLLLGEAFNAWDYHGKPESVGNWGSYCEKTDTYEVSFGTDYWGGASCEITYGSQPEITITDIGATVIASISFYSSDSADFTAYSLQYNFERVIADGMQYYRLESVENAKK